VFILKGCSCKMVDTFLWELVLCEEKNFFFEWINEIWTQRSFDRGGWIFLYSVGAKCLLRQKWLQKSYDLSKLAWWQSSVVRVNKW
jgi:hypothetical protein